MLAPVTAYELLFPLANEMAEEEETRRGNKLVLNSCCLLPSLSECMLILHAMKRQTHATRRGRFASEKKKLIFKNVNINTQNDEALKI